ncbi:MAG: hypothetical protein ACO1SV_27705 [Fimbriimonas sp.]
MSGLKGGISKAQGDLWYQAMSGPLVRGVQTFATAAGSMGAISATGASYVRFTGSTASGYLTLPVPQAGQELVIHNAATQAVTVYANDNYLIGQGAAISIPAGERRVLVGVPSLRLWDNAVNEGALDADALDWYGRVVAAGGTVSGRTLAAVGAFAAGCKADGIWTLLSRANLQCGDFPAAAVPLKVGTGSALDTLTNFTPAQYSESLGLLGNGSTRYVRTGLLASDLAAGNRHLSIYQRVASVPTFDYLIGVSTAANVQVHGMLTLGTGSTAILAYGAAGADGPTLPVGNVPGHLLMTQTSTTSVRVYLNGGGEVTGAVAAATPPAFEYYVLARNAGGSPASQSDARIAGYTIGLGLTAGQALALYNRLQAFNTALGRQV